MISLLAILLLAPLLLLLTLSIRIYFGPRVFFKQKRTGLQGRIFTIIKFRSMPDTRNSKGDLLDDDQRTTPFGNFLRSTSMDELPELINVLKGEMSLIGPRPLLPEYLELYNEQQARRHEVMPGITGWAQVNGRNSLDWDDKFQKDVWYVDNIMFMTISRLFRKDDITYAGHASMPKFTGNDAAPAKTEDKGQDFDEAYR